MVAKGANNKAIAFALEFVGSLIYLGVLFGSNASIYGSSLTAAGALWLPILYAVAVVASIALFFLSFGNYIAKDVKMITTYACGATGLGAFSLVALLWSNSGFFAGTIIGFIIAMIGTWYGEK